MTAATEFTYDDYAYSDLHKDVYGFRPRGSQWESWKRMTPAEKQVEWDFLVGRLGALLEEERQHQAYCAEKFEKRVATTIELGAKDRETALRWIYQADCGDDNGFYDWDYLCYHNGLEYGYFKEAA